MIGVTTKGDVRTHIQDGWWPVKLILLIGMCVGSFFIPNAFFEYYGWFALAAAGLFILVQLILLIDFAHTWAENWIEKMENEEPEGTKKWFYILLTATGVLFSASLALTIVMYVFFAKDQTHCGTNTAFITLNLIFCFLISIVSIAPKVQEFNARSGLLQSALITAYSTYLIFSAQMSETDSCNPWKSNGSTGAAGNVTVILGAIFTIMAICYATINAANTTATEQHTGEREKLVEHVEEGEEGNVQEDGDDHVNPDEPVTYNFSRFHLVFALGAMYLAMLMSDWHTVYRPATDVATVDTGLAAVWVKVVTSWICLLLYGWTLVAPVLLPNREWN
jgi:preprotein translocase subunit SecG